MSAFNRSLSHLLTCLRMTFYIKADKGKRFSVSIFIFFFYNHTALDYSIFPKICFEFINSSVKREVLNVDIIKDPFYLLKLRVKHLCYVILIIQSFLSIFFMFKENKCSSGTFKGDMELPYPIINMRSVRHLCTNNWSKVYFAVFNKLSHLVFIKLVVKIN